MRPMRIPGVRKIPKGEREAARMRREAAMCQSALGLPKRGGDQLFTKDDHHVGAKPPRKNLAGRKKGTFPARLPKESYDRTHHWVNRNLRPRWTRGGNLRYGEARKWWGGKEVEMKGRGGGEMGGSGGKSHHFNRNA